MTGNPSPDANTKTSTASVESEYQRLRKYEQQYDTTQMEIRKLASIWLLAALGAVAYLVREDGSKAIVNAMILIGIVGLMGNIGLLVLWILDQLVYHSLLNAVFLLLDLKVFSG